MTARLSDNAIPIIQPLPKRRTFSLTSLVVVPLKQHLGCCVIVPGLLKLVGTVGVIGGLLNVSGRFHVWLSLGLAPFVVALCLWLDDKFHAWQHRRGHYARGRAHAHGLDCTSCAPCPVDHTRSGFRRRYLVNLVLAFAVILLIESFHHHTH